MKKVHQCKITTLKNQEWFKKSNIKGTVLMCQCLSNIQVRAGDKYFEISNPGSRGVMSEKDAKAGIFDIACNPIYEPIHEAVKIGYLQIIKEKIINDLEVYRKLTEEMGFNHFNDNTKITFEDVSNHITGKDKLQKLLDKKIAKRAKTAVNNAIYSSGSKIKINKE